MQQNEEFEHEPTLTERSILIDLGAHAVVSENHIHKEFALGAPRPDHVEQ
jgi:hypothetical protein